MKYVNNLCFALVALSVSAVLLALTYRILVSPMVLR